MKNLQTAWVSEFFNRRETLLLELYEKIINVSILSNYVHYVENELKDGLSPYSVSRMSPLYRNMKRKDHIEWLIVAVHGVHYANDRHMNAHTTHFLKSISFKSPHIQYLCQQPNENIYEFSKWIDISNEIFELTRKMAYKISNQFNRLSDNVELDDLKQICCEELWENILEYHPENDYSFSTFFYRNAQGKLSRASYDEDYLVTICFNKMHNIWKFKRESDKHYAKTGEKLEENILNFKYVESKKQKYIEELNNDLIEKEPSPEDITLNNQRINIIVEAIEKLDDPYKTIIKCFYYNDKETKENIKKYNEYISSLKWSESLLKIRKIKAKELLRNILNPLKDELLTD